MLRAGEKPVTGCMKISHEKWQNLLPSPPLQTCRCQPMRLFRNRNSVASCVIVSPCPTYPFCLGKSCLMEHWQFAISVLPQKNSKAIRFLSLMALIFQSNQNNRDYSFMIFLSSAGTSYCFLAGLYLASKVLPLNASALWAAVTLNVWTA